MITKPLMAMVAALSLSGCGLSGCAGPSRDAGPPPVLTDSLGMRLVLVPAGEFGMGSTEDEAGRFLAAMREQRVHDWYQASPPGELPKRRVRITRPYYLGAFEVTVAQFRRFVEAAGYRTEAERDGRGGAGIAGGRWTERPEFNWQNRGEATPADDEPVVNVTWGDAVEFCQWLSEREGALYRLPTEAEWERACRAGADGPYPWGDRVDDVDRHAWHGGNSGGKIHPVGRLQPNGFELYDMLGNAYEYCQDRYSPHPAGLGQSVDPTGPASGDARVASGEARVVRGASWGTLGMHCRSAFRGDAGLSHRNQRDGFRVLREPAPQRNR